MCSNPQTLPGGEKVACRVCNECLAVTKLDWVSRAVAEMHTAPTSVVLTLTYDGSKQAADGAKAFRYTDFREFIQRVKNNGRSLEAKRRDLPVKEVPVPEVRFLVAGERGSMKGRVHWHAILYASISVQEIGIWADFDKQYSAGVLPSEGPKAQFVQPFEYRKRLVWDQWPMGYVFADAMNLESAEYVLKYINKSRFNVVKSKGTAREHKSEVSGASLFRMSKTPPLGAAYLRTQVERWKTLCHVPPDGMVIVPGLKGKWFPRRHMREMFLDGLASVFHHSIDQRGEPPQGWGTLLKRWEQTEAGAKIAEQLLERLEDGTEEEDDTIVRNPPTEAVRRAKIKACGNVYPCSACRNGLTGDEIGNAAEQARKSLVAFHSARAKAEARGRAFPYTWDEYQRAQNRIHPLCKLRGWRDLPTGQQREPDAADLYG
jgi:hypothetical protein